MALDLRSSELEHQFIQDRISSVEDNFAELCTEISKYVKRTGQLRDSGDELAKVILKISSKEILNHSLRGSLSRFSDILTAIQDYREAQVQRLSHKILFPLTSYAQICKHAKEDLKKSFSARTRELTKKNHLEKMRGRRTSNWQQLRFFKYFSSLAGLRIGHARFSHQHLLNGEDVPMCVICGELLNAEHEAEKARNESTQATHILAQKIDGFEKKKLEDIKAMFLEFANIELLFHCKAVELYTTAYGMIKDIKIDDDLQTFRDRFKSCSVAEVNLDQTNSGNTTAVPETSPAKNVETLSLKTLDAVEEETATTESSCTEISYESTLSNATSEAKTLTDIQTFKSFRWNY